MHIRFPLVSLVALASAVSALPQPTRTTWDAPASAVDYGSITPRSLAKTPALSSAMPDLVKTLDRRDFYKQADRIPHFNPAHPTVIAVNCPEGKRMRCEPDQPYCFCVGVKGWNRLPTIGTHRPLHEFAAPFIKHDPLLNEVLDQARKKPWPSFSACSSQPRQWTALTDWCPRVCAAGSTVKCPAECRNVGYHKPNETSSSPSTVLKPDPLGDFSRTGRMPCPRGQGLNYLCDTTPGRTHCQCIKAFDDALHFRSRKDYCDVGQRMYCDDIMSKILMRDICKCLNAGDTNLGEWVTPPKVTPWWVSTTPIDGPYTGPPSTTFVPLHIASKRVPEIQKVHADAERTWKQLMLLFEDETVNEEDKRAALQSFLDSPVEVGANSSEAQATDEEKTGFLDSERPSGKAEGSGSMDFEESDTEEVNHEALDPEEHLAAVESPSPVDPQGSYKNGGSYGVEDAPDSSTNHAKETDASMSDRFQAGFEIEPERIHADDDFSGQIEHDFKKQPDRTVEDEGSASVSEAFSSTEGHLFDEEDQNTVEKRQEKWEKWEFSDGRDWDTVINAEYSGPCKPNTRPDSNGAWVDYYDFPVPAWACPKGTIGTITDSCKCRWLNTRKRQTITVDTGAETLRQARVDPTLADDADVQAVNVFAARDESRTDHDLVKDSAATPDITVERVLGVLPDLTSEEANSLAGHEPGIHKVRRSCPEGAKLHCDSGECACHSLISRNPDPLLIANWPSLCPSGMQFDCRDRNGTCGCHRLDSSSAAPLIPRGTCPEGMIYQCRPDQESENGLSHCSCMSLLGDESDHSDALHILSIRDEKKRRPKTPEQQAELDAKHRAAFLDCVRRKDLKTCKDEWKEREEQKQIFSDCVDKDGWDKCWKAYLWRLKTCFKMLTFDWCKTRLYSNRYMRDGLYATICGKPPYMHDCRTGYLLPAAKQIAEAPLPDFMKGYYKGTETADSKTVEQNATQADDQKTQLVEKRDFGTKVGVRMTITQCFEAGMFWDRNHVTCDTRARPGYVPGTCSSDTCDCDCDFLNPSKPKPIGSPDPDRWLADLEMTARNCDRIAILEWDPDTMSCKWGRGHRPSPRVDGVKDKTECEQTRGWFWDKSADKCKRKDEDTLQPVDGGSEVVKGDALDSEDESSSAEQTTVIQERDADDYDDTFPPPCGSVESSDTDTVATEGRNARLGEGRKEAGKDAMSDDEESEEESPDMASTNIRRDADDYDDTFPPPRRSTDVHNTGANIIAEGNESVEMNEEAADNAATSPDMGSSRTESKRNADDYGDTFPPPRRSAPLNDPSTNNAPFKPNRTSVSNTTTTTTTAATAAFQDPGPGALDFDPKAIGPRQRCHDSHGDWIEETKACLPTVPKYNTPDHCRLDDPYCARFHEPPLPSTTPVVPVPLPGPPAY